MPKIIRNVLTRAKTLQLYDWLRDSKERIEKESLTQPEVARQASLALQFQVSTGNIQGLDDSVGIKWAKSAASLTAASETKRRLAELEAECQRLRIAVNWLCSQLNVTPPSGAGVPSTSNRQVAVVNPNGPR